MQNNGYPCTVHMYTYKITFKCMLYEFFSSSSRNGSVHEKTYQYCECIAKSSVLHQMSDLEAVYCNPVICTRSPQDELLKLHKNAINSSSVLHILRKSQLSQ